MEAEKENPGVPSDSSIIPLHMTEGFRLLVASTLLNLSCWGENLNSEGSL